MTFFGLTLDNISEKRISLFTQIHEIVFHGNGGYDWDVVYNLPIWLRKFVFSKLNDYYKEKNTSPDQQNVVIGEDGLIKNKSLLDNKTPTISKPNISVKKPISYK